MHTGTAKSFAHWTTDFTIVWSTVFVSISFTNSLSIFIQSTGISLNKFKEEKNVNNNYGIFNSTLNPSANRVGDTKKYPTSLLTFCRPSSAKMLHPTEKPTALLEYLINTYTNFGDTVLDNCMGSGTTGVSCINTGRNFIGIELDEKYFNIAKDRIDKSTKS